MARPGGRNRAAGLDILQQLDLARSDPRLRQPRSIRTLSEGSDLALDFGMEDLLSAHQARRDCSPEPFTNKLKRLHIRINTGFWKQT